MRHVGIVVENIEAAIVFWRELFGYDIEIDQIEVGREIDNLLAHTEIVVRTVKMIHPSLTRLELLQFNSPPVIARESITPFSKGITHIAFTVPQLEISLRRLETLGGSIVGRTESKDKNIEVAYCLGVEGVLLELVEVKTGSFS